MSDVDEKLEALVGRLAATESEYATVAGSRTRKDMRELAKSWIASRLAQVDASIAFVLNGHVGAVESQAVREKLDLEDKRERIIAAAEATTTLTNRQRDSEDAEARRRDGAAPQAAQRGPEAGGDGTARGRVRRDVRRGRVTKARPRWS